jgi:hypothetical protein
VILDGNEKQNAFILALFADAPLSVECVGDVFHRLAVERIDGDDGHLNARDLLHLAAVRFKLLVRLRGEDVREIVDVALGFEGIEI